MKRICLGLVVVLCLPMFAGCGSFGMTPAQKAEVVRTLSTEMSDMVAVTVDRNLAELTDKITKAAIEKLRETIPDLNDEELQKRLDAMAKDLRLVITNEIRGRGKEEIAELVADAIPDAPEGGGGGLGGLAASLIPALIPLLTSLVKKS